MISKFPIIELLFLILAFRSCTCGQAAAKSNIRCIQDLSVLWSRELSTFPYAATPLITDVDGDGQLDIVAASHGGDVHVLRASDGQSLPGWPQKLSHSSLFSSPLQFDVDNDGDLDIIITTGNGQIVSFNYDGTQLSDKTYQVDPLLIKRDWYKEQLSADEDVIHDFILDTLDASQHDGTAYIEVDPHVLATPVLADLNADGVIEELVIPVSYYYDADDYSNIGAALPHHLTQDELNHYLAGALVILNMTSLQVIRTIHLELTKVTSEYPGYVLFSPTLADLHGNHSSLEIVVATSAGHIHAFDLSGHDLPGFPIHTDSIMGQVTVADMNGDGQLDLVTQDVSGNVACYTASGHILWEAQISGSMPSGSRVLDLDLDHNMEDIIMSTDDGMIYVLDGRTGEHVPGWPFSVADSFKAPPLIMPVTQQNIPSVVAMGNDGLLNVISLDRKSCRNNVPVGEQSLVSVLSHDMIPHSPGLEMVIVTTDGSLLCLGSGVSSEDVIPFEMNTTLFAWPAENRVTNSFTYHTHQLGVYITTPHETAVEFSGSTFVIAYTVVDEKYSMTRSSPNRSYRINIYLGSQLIYTQHDVTPGSYTPVLPCPTQPLAGHLVVNMVINHGEVFQDKMAIRFHRAALSDLPLLLVGPALGMTCLLLFLHGFPNISPLPLSINQKKR